MKKNFVKWLCVVLAFVMILPTIRLHPMAASSAPSAGGEVNIQSTSNLLKVEIEHSKEKISVFGKMGFTATVTNISNETVKNVRAEVSFGKGLRPLKKSQVNATKVSLAPGESFPMRYYADVARLVSLDVMFYPIFWVSHLFHGGKIDAKTADYGTSGDAYAGRSFRLKFLTTNMYEDIFTAVRVWYEDASIDDQFSFTNFSANMTEIPVGEEKQVTFTATVDTNLSLHDFNIRVRNTATALKNHPKQPLKAVHDSWYPSPLICGAFSG